MPSTKEILIFGAGVGLGLLIAKVYMKQQVTTGVDSLLGKVGLGGGKVQSFTDDYVVPEITG